MGNWPRFVCFSHACCNEQKSFVSRIFLTPWSAVMDVSCVRILHLNLEVFFVAFFFPVDPLWPPVRHKKPTKKFLSPDFFNIQIKRGIFVADRPYKRIKGNRKLLVDAKRVDSDPFPAHEKRKKSRKATIMTSFLSRVINDKTPISPPKKSHRSPFRGWPLRVSPPHNFLWLFSFRKRKRGKLKASRRLRPPSFSRNKKKQYDDDDGLIYGCLAPSRLSSSPIPN